MKIRFFANSGTFKNDKECTLMCIVPLKKETILTTKHPVDWLTRHLKYWPTKAEGFSLQYSVLVVLVYSVLVVLVYSVLVVLVYSVLVVLLSVSSISILSVSSISILSVSSISVLSFSSITQC